MAVVDAGPWTFVRLKLRLTANGLRGQTWRIALFVVGLLFGGVCAVGGYALFAVPGLLDEPRAATMLLTLGGSALVLGWLFLPLVFFGVDESLDPARFALLPLRRRALIRGLFAASLAGVPALATLAATLGMVDTAARLGGVLAALAELAGVLLGLLMCAAISRATTSAFATALRSRRARDLATLLLAVLAALIGPLQLIVLAGARSADLDRVARVAAVVQWTPLGAPYTLGLDVAAGRAWAVPVKLLIVVATLGLLLRWWSATLERAMLGLAAPSGRTRAAASTPVVRRLVLRGLPRTRFGALMSREMRYWWRETRRRAGLITFGVVGLFLPVSLSVSVGGGGGGGGSPMLLIIGVLAAVSLVNQFGYEGSAYAANVVAGVPGRVELQSRAAALSVFVIPLLVLIAVVVGVSSGEPAHIPAMLGTLLASYGLGLAVAVPMSVRGAYALPDTTNPFAMNSGGGLAKSLITFAALFTAMLASVPLQIAAYLVPDVWLVAGLPAGLVYGGVAYFVGSRVGGDLLDRRMPELLAAVTAR